MQPWPTAYTFWHTQAQPPLRVIVNRAVWRENPEAGFLPPGLALLGPEARSHLRLAAGEQTEVEVLELQPAGKRRMSALEFLRGHRLQPGDHFGLETS
jgi:methionyl-tRNA formyltransferase